jgi:crotonobetainyl-CoA:carnitine CoA-transferase CaiB-like acyl-CoA transferase
MYDAAVAMTDIVMNLTSLGQPVQPFPKHFILDTFRAADGWFVMQLVREHQFGPLADIVGRPEWKDDPRLATRQGWGEHLEDIIRPGVEAWSSSRSMVEASKELTAAGVAAGPCFHSSDVVNDPHLERRRMIVEMDRVDGVDQPVLVPGNPVKLSKVAEGPETRVPWTGEHTRKVLADELGLSERQLDALAEQGVIA